MAEDSTDQEEEQESHIDVDEVEQESHIDADEVEQEADTLKKRVTQKRIFYLRLLIQKSC